MKLDECILDLKRAAALVLSEYDGDRNADLTRDEWAAEIVRWRDARAKIAVTTKRANKANAEREETQRRLEAMGCLLVSDERMIEVAEASTEGQ